MGWLDNMVLRSKLLLLTSVMLIALAATGIMGFMASNNGEEGIREIGESRVPKIIGLATLRTGQNQITIQQFRIRGLNNDPEYKTKVEDALKAYEVGLKNIEAGFKTYDPLPRNKEAEEAWSEAKKNLEAWKKDSIDFQDNIMKPLTRESDPKKVAFLFEEMTKYMDKMRATRTKMIEGLAKLTKLNEDATKAEVESAIAVSSKLKAAMIITMVVSVIISILLAILIIRSVTMSITKAVTTINDGALQISSASDQVASSSTSLAQGASEQASSVEEVSATLEEATAGVTSNTENARQADILAKQTNAAAKDGLAKGEELIVSMKDVTESAAKIANIVKTIDQIAFQVNLLSLNAAVEAARAGEHGLGFAVVADEVRNLAQRSANSAKETETVIKEVVTQIKKGSEIASAASASFREIDDKAKKVSDLIGEVALSSREQAEGLGQLNVAMSQIDQVTQQVAANSEEAAAASEELNAQAAAALEAVAALAKIVGIEVHSSQNYQKAPVKHLAKMEIKKEARNIPHKSQPPRQAAKPAQKSSDEIFPLDENDLKEF